MKKVLFFTMLTTLLSCETEQQSERLIVVSGRIIDNTNNIDFENTELTASFLIDTKVKQLATSKLDKYGNFTIEYYTKGNYTGNNLWFSFWPQIPTRSKFDFLPYGTSWHKDFYLTDSATVVIMLNQNINNNDSIYLNTSSSNFKFSGPTSNNFLSKIRIANYNDSFIYSKNRNAQGYISIYPTGDPIVDTITLNINP